MIEKNVFITKLLEEIDRLEAKATKGPWDFVDHGEPNTTCDDSYTVCGPGEAFDRLDRCLLGDALYYNTTFLIDDAEFITALRNAWPRIREEILK